LLAALHSPGAIALVGALAGVLGALAGSAVSGFATYKTEGAASSSSGGRRSVANVENATKTSRQHVPPHVCGTRASAISPRWFGRG